MLASKLRIGEEDIPTSISLVSTGGWTFNYNTGTSSSDSITGSSNNKTDSSSSTLTLAVVGTGTIYYSCTVSSETNFDWLYFKKNGADVFTRISGSTTRTGNLAVSDGDTLAFQYTKDGSVSSNADTGYVNALYFI